MTANFPDRNMFLDFDRFFGNLDLFHKNGHPSQNTYPPHNVIKEGEDHYLIELAVAGYNPDDISVSIEEKNVLAVSCNKVQKEEVTSRKYVHTGISTKAFVKRFILSESMVVREAKVSDGILSIKIENIIPEEKKPRKIQLIKS